MLKLRFLRVALSCIALLGASPHCFGFATIKFLLNGHSVECLYDIIDYEYYYGLGPGAINILVVDKDSTEYCIYESIGCSIYETTKSAYSTFDITVYSDLACQWTTDVSIEDREHPLCPEEADIKFSLKFVNNGNLTGRISPINFSEKNKIYLDDNKHNYELVPVPKMEKILKNPLDYYSDFSVIIRAYLADGISPNKIYDFMLAFDHELKKTGFKDNPNDPYYQSFTIYKFLLKYFDKDLDLDALKELGETTRDVRIFYGNPSLSPKLH